MKDSPQVDSTSTRLPISQEAIQETTKCPRNQDCLRGESGCLCKVEQAIGEKYAFVRGGSRLHCPYCILFGSTAFVCMCPVRNEMYRRNGV